jgi:hypothetical protein
VPASQIKQQEVAARRAKALAMRAAGATFSMIAKECKHKTPAAAAQDVARALKERQKLDEGQRPLSGVLEEERLDSVQRIVEVTLRRASTAQDGPLVLKAAGRLLDIGKRREQLGAVHAAEEKPAPQVSPIDELLDRRDRKRAQLGWARPPLGAAGRGDARPRGSGPGPAGQVRA